jgi:hypothetical protein
MKKILIISVIVSILILIIIGVLFLYIFIKKEEPKKEIENTFSILETEDIPYNEEYRFKLDTAEFIVHPANTEDFEFGYFEALNNGEKVYASDPLYMIWDLFAFEYEANKYIIVTDYSGGAHCCFEEYIFLLDKNSELKLLDNLYLGETSIMEDSLLIKNNILYIKKFDDRFAYFYTPYVNSYFFVQYLEVKPEGFEINNVDFREDYLEEAVSCENDLNELIEQKIENFENYSPLLTCIIINYILAEEKETAWQKFNEYSSLISLYYYGQVVDLEQFKKELIELL